MEFSPFVGPDSLRQFLYLSKKLYENHTPRTYGFEDTKGSYYEGSVENWGAEELMESRKLLLDKPSLKNILVENSFDYYFEVKYSGFVNTYDQQSMLCALLRKDVLLSNHTYKLRFDNAVEFSVPRAKSSSDDVVVKDSFIMTFTPPTLVEDDSVNHTLKLTDVTGASTVYFFHLDVETEDIIDTYEDNVLITKELDDSMNGYPMIWMCVNVLKTLPDVRLEGNEYGEDEKPLLTIGTNGHDMTLVYPFLSLSSDEINLDKVLIKILPSENGSFYTDPADIDLNFSTDVYEIHFCIYPDEIDIHVRPQFEYTVIYNSEIAKMTIRKDRMLGWEFRKPVEGDYDYDGVTYHNRVYAYIYASTFVNNLEFNYAALAMLQIHMYEEYMYPTEYLSLNTYAGTHIDVTSDHSDNGVNKKNGVIHSLGDFDGLPRYFKYDENLIYRGKMMNKKIHRAHVEMYALRDNLNDPYPKAMTKPTAGVIVDSGIPQVEYDDMVDDLPLTIVFDNLDPDRRHFYWDPNQPPVSKFNILSEINYVDMYHLGNARILSQQSKRKLIYHGNRHFSLYKTGFDPELEYGRVYIISNDKAVFENNGESAIPKAPTTFARICDIPTEYSQITGIENLCPTFVFDPDYVRTEANFSYEDVEYLWNCGWAVDTDESRNLIFGMDHILHDGKRYVFDPMHDPNYETLGENQYPIWDNLYNLIDLGDVLNLTYDINTSLASGYEVGDRFDFFIGGICIKGQIEEMDGSRVIRVSYMNQNTGEYGDFPVFYRYNGLINYSMIDHNITEYPTNKKSGVGTGLRIRLTIDSTYYNSMAKSHDGILPSTIYFFKDDYGIISINEYLTDDQGRERFIKGDQVTGLTEYKNSYDTSRSRKYTLLDTFLYDKMTGNAYVPPESTVDVWSFFSGNIYNRQYELLTSENEPYDWGYGEYYYDEYGHKITFENTGTEEAPVWVPVYVKERFYRKNNGPALDPSGMMNMSPYLNDDNIDRQDSYYILQASNGITSDHAMITRFSMNDFVDEGSKFTNINYPDFGDLNLEKYYMKTNVLKYNFDTDLPSVSFYDPNMADKMTYNDIGTEVREITSSQPLTYKDLFVESRFTPEGLIDSDGILTTNVYVYNECDDSYRKAKKSELMGKEREDLIKMIEKLDENAYPLKLESSEEFKFSKNMLINYILDNTLYWGPDEVYYTDAPQSIYRRQGVSLFEHKNTQVMNRAGKPLTKQPNGAFVDVIQDLDVERTMNNKSYRIKPEYIFRLDGVDPDDLVGFRMYDGENDISEETMLIINGVRYIARIRYGGISWVEIQRRNDDESE